MLQALQRRLRKEEGFTLIEMMAVVLIIGILVAVATVSIPRFLRDARKSNLRQTIAALQVGAERFKYNSPDEEYPVVGAPFQAGDLALPIDWAATDDNGETLADYVEDGAALQGLDPAEYALDNLNANGEATLQWGISADGTVFVTNLAEVSWAVDTNVFTRRGVVTLTEIDGDDTN